MNFIKFKPLYQERIWGGNGLKSQFARSLPESKYIGESWELVDRPEAQSVIACGAMSGLTLRQAIEQHGAQLLGPDYPLKQPFPLLVKWLDCQKRLSLQVHPPATVADALKGEPKTENWYVATAQPDATIVVGFEQEITREIFKESLRTDTFESLIHRVSVGPGDSMFVPSGRIHAIEGGVLVLEIQQNSDTTYRIYDWGRKGINGESRQLHIEESLQCINFNDVKPNPLQTNSDAQIIADCPEFCIRKISLNSESGPLVFEAEDQPRLLHIISGRIVEKKSGAFLNNGDNVLLPFSVSFNFEAVDNAVLLVTENFIG